MSIKTEAETAEEDKKKEAEDSLYLTGKLLMAMPGMGDPRFYKSVIFMCAHDKNGAMGLVINRTLPGLDMSRMLKQLNIDFSSSFTDRHNKMPVMSGGPVETARGFILHSGDFEQADTMYVNNDFKVTGTIDALKAIATGQGPDNMLFMLGYSGWGQGQLDEEIKNNAWLVSDPDSNIIFDSDPNKKWNIAVQKLGIDPAMLSGNAGRA